MKTIRLIILLIILASVCSCSKIIHPKSGKYYLVLDEHIVEETYIDLDFENCRYDFLEPSQTQYPQPNVGNLKVNGNSFEAIEFFSKDPENPRRYWFIMISENEIMMKESSEPLVIHGMEIPNDSVFRYID